MGAALGIAKDVGQKGFSDANLQAACDALKGPIVVLKGPADRIASPCLPGREPAPILVCDEEGAPRRPGGLGDFLSGSMAVFVGWAAERRVDPRYACQAASFLVRRACKAAYEKKKRSMVAPDVLDEV